MSTEDTGVKRIILTVLHIFVISFTCRAQTESDYAFYLDLSYSLTGFQNHGWGIGLTYERKLLDHFSGEGNLGHMTFLTDIENVYSTSVSLSLFANYYPLSRNLDKLYIGAGNGCDFMHYFGKGKLPPSAKDIIIHITPRIGWKFHIFSFLMIDLSAGYKFIVSNTQNHREIKNYVNPGFRFGFDFMIFLNTGKREMHDE